MDRLTYEQKSPEKSSPSFPEDVDDDEDPIHMESIKFTPCKMVCTNDLRDDGREPPDVTMLADDDDDDFMQNRTFSHTVDSPRQPNDSSEKKVHWSNQNVQTLLDCVERHLDEFNVQKKHKQVWQTIGSEMENLGFTMEHCYNKWKNLRRDVRLLVNNPQKAVRNADILRRVARLILVIYPNIDATTMQVSGERSCGKSAPVTPVSVALNYKMNLHSSHHGPDSPRYILPNASAPITPGYHPVPSNGMRHRRDAPVPGAALFTNLNNDHDSQDYPTEAKPDSQNTSLPFIFNSAAAALLVQSQLFNDLIRQQRQQLQDDETLDVEQTDHPPASVCNSKYNGPCHTEAAATNGNSPHANGTSHTVSLASNLLNGLIATNNGSNTNLFSPQVSSANITDTQNLLDRIPPGSELANVVERLRDEETVHLRLTDMVTHIADELRAAGLRRRATLDQLLDIMQGSRLPTSLIQPPKTADTSNLV